MKKLKSRLLKAFLVSLAVLTLSACAGSSGSSSGTSYVTSLEFKELALPATAAEEGSIRVSPAAIIGWSDGTTTEVPLAYDTLYKTGDSDSSGILAGQLMDKFGFPILFSDNSPRFSVQPDASAFFYRGGKYYHITHFEASPGALYLSELSKDANGKLTVAKFTNVDFSSVGGTVINCSAQKTPWDTFLSAEEDYYFGSYQFDENAANYHAWNIKYCEKDNATGKLTGVYKAPAFAPTADYGWWCTEVTKPLITDYLHTTVENFNAYNYGHVVELDVSNSGVPFVVGGSKLFTTGKFTPEVAVVMPDNKTVYMLDDGSYTGIFMFVADKAKDLTSGTLYAAKVNQKSADDTDGGSLGLDWIKLGSATNGELKSFVDRNPKMSDFFEIADPNACPTGFTKMWVYDGDGSPMCIKSKTSSAKFNSTEIQKAAAFLEPRKVGALLGATMEFSKGEGVSYDADRNSVYLVMSRVEASMTKGKGTTATQDDIRLKENKCGVVYESTFGEAKDKNGASINSQYVLRNMDALLKGTKLAAGDNGSDKNYCSPYNIAGPDNILYIGNNTLLISEDTGYHYNNMLWSYNTKSKKLTRVATVYPGAEVTGASANIDIDGKMVIALNAQHPYGESRQNVAGTKLLSAPTYDVAEKLTDSKYKGVLGYIRGLPSFKK